MRQLFCANEQNIVIQRLQVVTNEASRHGIIFAITLSSLLAGWRTDLYPINFFI